MGLRLSERAARILAEAVAAEEAAHDEASSPKGTIRLAAPMSFGLLHVAPAVADFLEQYTALPIDLHLSDEKIDIIQQSKERSAGKECVSTCGTWWSPYHERKKQNGQGEAGKMKSTTKN